jgi:multicomponent Na+:H+ antiporter subunit C
METLLALTIGGLYAVGIYLMLRRSLVKLILGLAILSHGANLLIFTVGGLTHAQAPIIPEGHSQLTLPYADPLPQAMILTAIVISFGVTAFTVVLLQRAYRAVDTDDLDQMKSTDR